MKKGTTKKNSSKKKKEHSIKNKNVEKALVENSIAIQKVLTNLAVKFETLSDRIQKLLDVFEISAKSLAEKDFKDFGKFDDKSINEKLDSLLDQNKTIAKSLILMHEKNIPESTFSSMPQRTPIQRQMPQYNQDYQEFSQPPKSQFNSVPYPNQNFNPNPNFNQNQNEMYTRSIAQQEPQHQDTQNYKQTQKS